MKDLFLTLVPESPRANDDASGAIDNYWRPLGVFASWRPAGALGGALLFAFCDAFQLRLQHVIGKAVPYQLFLMLPYLISILALLLVARRARVPQALMVPYRRGER